MSLTATPTDDAILARVLDAQRTALDSLQSAAGDQSLCTLSHERVNAAKYFEGAVTALGDAARALRAGDDLPAPEEWGGIAAVRAETDARWRSYLVGGREALAAVR